MADDNRHILELIQKEEYNIDQHTLDLIMKRLEFGRQKYGHGIIIKEDTSKYASSWDTCSASSWNVMCLEEMLDGIVYAAASIIQNNNDTNNNKIKEVLKLCIKASKLLCN